MFYVYRVREDGRMLFLERREEAPSLFDLATKYGPGRFAYGKEPHAENCDNVVLLPLAQKVDKTT